MLKFFASSFGENGDSDKKVAYERSSWLGCFQAAPNQDAIESFWAHVKTFLDNVDKRWDGLRILHTFLPDCHTHIVEANSFMWFQTCFQTLNGKSPRCMKQLACKVVCLVVRRLAEFPAVEKDVAEKLLPFMIDAVVKLSPEEQWHDSGLTLLSVMMVEFQGYCFLRKNEIEVFLFKILEGMQFDDIESLGNCFSYLPLIGTRSSNSTQYSNYWFETVKKLLGVLHEILKSLEDWIRLDGPEDGAVNGEDVEPMMAVHSSRQFHAVSHCLVKMFGYAKYPVTAPVNAALEVIETPLKLIPERICVAARDSEMLVFVSSTLPTIQCACLLILESLMQSCHTYLVPKVSMIGDILCDMLLAASRVGGKCSARRSYSEKAAGLLRLHLYKVLLVWIEKLRPVISEEHCQKIYSSIKKDISPVAQPSKSTPQIRDGAKRHNTRAATAAAACVGRIAVNTSVKSEVCAAALKVLSSMLYSSEFVETHFIKAVEKEISHIVMMFQHSQKVPFPYDDPMCRLEAYKVLQNVLISKSMSGFLLPLAITSFRKGERDSNIEVSSFCINASRVCGVLLSSAKVISVEIPVSSKDELQPSGMQMTFGQSLVDCSSSSMPSVQLSTQTAMFAEAFQDVNHASDFDNHIPMNGPAAGVVSPSRDTQKHLDPSKIVNHDKYPEEEIDNYEEEMEEEDDVDEEDEDEPGDEEDEEALDEEEEEEADEEENQEYAMPYKSRKRLRSEQSYTDYANEEEDEEDDDYFEEKCVPETEDQHPPAKSIVPGIANELSNSDELLKSRLGHLPTKPDSRNGFSHPTVVNENGINSSASEENVEECVVPAKKPKHNHNPPREVDEADVAPDENPNDPGGQENVQDAVDVNSMLGDFVNCSPDSTGNAE